MIGDRRILLDAFYIKQEKKRITQKENLNVHSRSISGDIHH